MSDSFSSPDLNFCSSSSVVRITTGSSFFFCHAVFSPHSGQNFSSPVSSLPHLLHVGTSFLVSIIVLYPAFPPETSLEKASNVLWLFIYFLKSLLLVMLPLFQNS